MTQNTTRAYENKTSYTSQNFKMYADVSALRDLLLDSGINTASWAIQVFGAGTLVVRPVHRKTNDNSADITLPTIPANTTLFLSVSALVSGTATNILVMW
jgi:hypothetical protein